jgi:E3 ubiquitin-protein ligase RNF115/126
MMEQTAGRNAPPPAAEDIIASLPQSKISVEEAESKLDCSICQDEFEPGGTCDMFIVRAIPA